MIDRNGIIKNAIKTFKLSEEIGRYQEISDKI